MTVYLLEWLKFLIVYQEQKQLLLTIKHVSKQKYEQALWTSFHTWKIKLDTLETTYNLFFWLASLFTQTKSLTNAVNLISITTLLKKTSKRIAPSCLSSLNYADKCQQNQSELYILVKVSMRDSGSTIWWSQQVDKYIKYPLILSSLQAKGKKKKQRIEVSSPSV